MLRKCFYFLIYQGKSLTHSSKYFKKVYRNSQGNSTFFPQKFFRFQWISVRGVLPKTTEQYFNSIRLRIVVHRIFSMKQKKSLFVKNKKAKKVRVNLCRGSESVRI